MRLLFLLFLCSTVMGQNKHTSVDTVAPGITAWLESDDPTHYAVYGKGDSAAWKKDSIDRVKKNRSYAGNYWDSTKVTMSPTGYPFFLRDKPKYDTIGGWHLVSDTVRNSSPSDYGGGGYINAVHAEYLYEVREYIKGNWIVDERGNAAGPVIPHHHLWLDSNKKPIKLKVWQ